jgi:hypothetical protein
MLLGGASSTWVSRPTHVPSQKTASRLVGLAEVVEGMIKMSEENLARNVDWDN